MGKTIHSRIYGEDYEKRQVLQASLETEAFQHGLEEVSYGQHGCTPHRVSHSDVSPSDFVT